MAVTDRRVPQAKQEKSMVRPGETSLFGIEPEVQTEIKINASQDCSCKAIELVPRYMDTVPHLNDVLSLGKESDLIGSILDSVQGIVYIIDSGGRVMHCNKAFESCSGYTYAEAHGRFIWELAAFPTDIIGEKKLFESLKFHRFPDFCTYCRVEKNGTKRLISWSSKVLLNGNEIKYIVSTGQDITDQSRMEQELHHRLVLEKAVAQASRLFMSPQGPDLQEILKVLLEAFSTKSASIFKYRSDALIIEEQYHYPDIEDQVEPFLTECVTPFSETMARLRKGGEVLLPGTAVARNGEEKNCLLIIPIHSITGNFVGMIKFTRENHPDFWSDENIRTIRVIADMVGIYWERERIQDEVIKTVERVEEANRYKSEFLANVSHEIRTPMNAILGMTELALDTELTQEQREYLEMAKSSADSLLGLLNDILDLSKIEAGHLDLDEDKFDLGNAVERAVDILTLKAHKKGLELVSQIKSDVPVLLIGDAGRLGQIIVNLGGNAMKFTETGEVFISCALEEMTGDSVLLHFQVSDTGIGIARDKLHMIFDSFYQVDGSTVRKHGGTGLGLSISKYLSESMGGKIWAESEPGKGSTFHFTARFKLQQLDKLSRLERIKHFQKYRSTRILVVDDNLHARVVLKEMISALGLMCREVPDGATALAELREAVQKGAPYDLVFLDAQMPGMDAVLVLQEISKDPLLLNAKAVLLTPKGQKRNASYYKTPGVSAYLLKPVKESDLAGLLQEILEKGALHQATRSIPVSYLKERNTRVLRILLAEDNLASRKLVTRLLEKNGHLVTCAETGEGALALIKQNNFDLIFMDVQMPLMDGFETTRRIRQWEQGRRARVPVVAMTAYAGKDDRRKCIEAGMDDYLAKPIKIQELTRIIEEVGPGEKHPDPGRPEPAENTATFNFRALLKDLGGDIELLKEALRLFKEDYPRHINSVRLAILANESEKLMGALHSMSGSVINFLFPAVDPLIQELRDSALKKDMKKAKRILSRLESQLDTFSANEPMEQLS